MSLRCKTRKPCCRKETSRCCGLFRAVLHIFTFYCSCTEKW